ncbi:hypothetical protein ACFFKC_09515 [Pseudoduganella danionis]|uniref:Uncharacterized protein n=2 Tax=Telluria group TaxID=2895353 RepID=A0A845I721_9BURK|nr:MULTISPECIES: hypothetical protein [Telluria group]MTW32739.1 hypothetical protein [Pseudoduganella danionis]MYN47518.1 hypothetical protein [Duganella fentianensis]
MRKLLLLFLFASGLVPVAHAEGKRPEVARYTMAFSGEQGYRVWITRLGAKENHEALVQISGIDHKLDGRVLRAKEVVQTGGNSVNYIATVDGKSYDLLAVQRGKAELLITGMAWTSELRYDKALADQRPPEHLLTDFLEGSTKR